MRQANRPQGAGDMIAAIRARWTRREREAAAALGSKRVHRKRGEKAPDVVQVRLENGDVLQAEVKHRKRGAKLVRDALVQAAGYAPGCIPLAVVSVHGESAIACLRLDDFVRVVGIKSPIAAAQLPLLLGRPSK
jgi:hypothetical protein